MTTDTRPSQSNFLVCLVLLIVACGLLTPAAGAADPTAGRLERKVRVMQKVIDEVLVQSEHVTVSPGGVTRGLVLEEYGVLFTFDASIGERLVFGNFFAPEVGMIHGDDIDLTSDEWAVPKPGKRLDKEEWKAAQKEEKEKRLRDREFFENELIDTLLDYGVTLAELDDEDWVSIAAFLGSGSLGFLGRDESEGDGRIVVRVKMRDLRRYMTGALSREEARATVVVEG